MSTARTAALDGAAIFDLGVPQVVRLEGPDARRFSNGMFTQNVRDLPVGGATRSAMTDDRGRVLGLMDLCCPADDSFLVVLEGVSAEWFEERYGRFIVFDDVELTDHSGELALLTVQGPGADAAIGELLGGSLSEGGVAVLGERYVVRRDRAGRGGRDLLVPAGAAAEHLEAARDQGLVIGEPEDLEVLRVRSGQPRWPVDRSGERTFVHELGLVPTVCSFTKGCYVGQEVINRMDTMGRPTKRLCGLVLPAGTRCEDEVLLDGGKVGRLGSSVEVDGTVYALAVLGKAAWEPGTEVQVGEAVGVVSALPFS